MKNSPLVQAFTSAKVVKSPVLNRMGLQIARSYAARWWYNIRPASVDANLRPLLRKLQSDGMVMIENFLPDEAFERLKADCLRLLEFDPKRITRKEMGPTQYSVAALKDYPDFKSEFIDQFYADPRLVGLMQAAEKRKIDMRLVHRAVEHVKQGNVTTEGDPETEMHSDVFYHTHKAWLYLTDVEPKDAPLAFVPGTHRLKTTQWKYIYEHSLEPDKPSRRIKEEELKKWGRSEVALKCKKNTLVLANVCGYHRRSVGQPGGERIALLCSVRSQPFAYWYRG